MERLAQTRAVYDPLEAETTTLALDGQVFEAKAMLLDKVRPAQKAYFEALDAVLKHQNEMLEASTEATQSAAAAMGAVIGVLLVVALAAGVAMALWIIRSTTRPLVRAVAMARAVALGDLPVDIEPQVAVAGLVRQRRQRQQQQQAAQPAAAPHRRQSRRRSPRWRCSRA